MAKLFAMTWYSLVRGEKYGPYCNDVSCTVLHSLEEMALDEFLHQDIHISLMS